MRCPSFERLIDYLDGRLADGEADRVAGHLASGCQQCAPTRAWYEGLRELVASDDTIEPPSWVLKRAVRIFDEKAARPNLVERLGRAVASLVFDSFAHPSLVGVRSTETANRQLLYHAGEYSIDLQIAPTDGAGVDMRGQVLREGEERFESVTGLKVELGRGNNRPRATFTGATGEFAFQNVEPGDYDLYLETEALGITVYGLPLKPSL
ncbi:MAG TPA: zf-HC2 domain-containing protein [Blastocatellia bacterium]|jgi:hypothetical protein|nr:zf-HC2 domain-containing protein [Blastocatellia bacterium]